MRDRKTVFVRLAILGMAIDISSYDVTINMTVIVMKRCLLVSNKCYSASQISNRWQECYIKSTTTTTIAGTTAMYAI